MRAYIVKRKKRRRTDVKIQEDIDVKEEDSREDRTFPEIKAEPIEVSYMCVSVTGHIAPVSRNVSCLWLSHMYGHSRKLHCCKWKCFTAIVFWRGVAVKDS
jgi:hypothetical protein